MKLTTPLVAALFVCSAGSSLAQGMSGEGRWGGGWRNDDPMNPEPRYPSARQSAQPSKKIDVTAYRSADAEALLGLDPLPEVLARQRARRQRCARCAP
jgi:hypothetical protein